MSNERPSSIILVPTPDVAYIRTGGIFSKAPKVSTSNILLRIPFIQKATPINLKAFGVTVEKTKQNCLRANDVFVDVRAVFTLQIDTNHIVKASEQFGTDTFSLANNVMIHNILEGALRGVIATMTLDELQGKRAEFTTAVTNSIVDEFKNLGLILLNTSILTLDQTGIEYINKNDILGARTSATTMYEIQTNKKKENDALRENEVLIATKDNEAAKKRIDLDVLLDNATVEAEKKRVEYARDKQIAIAKATAEQEQQSQTALIKKDIAILEQEGLKLIQQESIAKKQQGVNEAEANAETVRLKSIKEREKQIAILDAEQIAESDVIKVKKDAEARYFKVEKDANAMSIQTKIEAEANYFKVEQEAKAMERLADAKEKNYKVEAAGIELKNKAENELSSEMIAYNQKMKLIETLPAIIREMVEPMKSISDVKIISANGLLGGVSSLGQSNGSVNDLFQSAFDYRLKSGVVDMLAKEAGLDLNCKSISDIIPTVVMNEDK